MKTKYNFYTASQEYLNINKKELDSLIESYIKDDYNVLMPNGRNIGGKYNERLLTAYYTIVEEN